MMGYKAIVQNLPPNAPDKNMWLLLAKNCFEIVKTADNCLKAIDSIMKQLDSAGDALSMMELKNILLSLRPEYKVIFVIVIVKMLKESIKISQRNLI